jgi:phosphoglucomutase
MGTNRINIYTISRATQGLANYLIEESQKQPHPQEYLNRGVVIAYDCRHKSREFSETIALVLNANNIKTYLFEDVRPTPELSFAVRHLNAVAGIVVTASHNPPEYNGYKVYGLDGGQIIPEVKELAIRDKDQIEIDKTIKIVYTPLHGAGNIPIRKILKERGFTNVFVVEEQAQPDPDFSTVESPNPEYPAAFELAIKLGQKVNAEILIATDPDADRIGMAVNGNQVGVLLLHYILSSKKELNQLPPNGFIVKTVVTSDMSRVIADSFGVDTYETLTGFKFICNMEKNIQEKEGKEFLFGYEESIGYLTGDFVRDKDAVISAMLIAEMTAYYYKNGLNLLQVLEGLYKKYGYYEEDQHSIYMEGAEGEKKIAEIMEIFRKEVLRIEGMEIVRIDDILLSESYDLKSRKTARLDLPRSNVLKIIFSDGSWYCLRPSGTEPKIKVYLSFHAKTKKEAQQKVHLAKSTILQKIDSIIEPGG